MFSQDFKKWSQNVTFLNLVVLFLETIELIIVSQILILRPDLPHTNPSCETNLVSESKSEKQFRKGVSPGDRLHKIIQKNGLTKLLQTRINMRMLMMDVDDYDAHATMRLSTQQHDESRHVHILLWFHDDHASWHVNYRRRIHGNDMRDSDTKGFAISDPYKAENTTPSQSSQYVEAWKHARLQH